MGTYLPILPWNLSSPKNSLSPKFPFHQFASSTPHYKCTLSFLGSLVHLSFYYQPSFPNPSIPNLNSMVHHFNDIFPVPYTPFCFIFVSAAAAQTYLNPDVFFFLSTGTQLLLEKVTHKGDWYCEILNTKMHVSPTHLSNILTCIY